jgi:putative transposase
MTETDNSSPGQIHIVTLSVAGNIDVFTRYVYCDIIVDNLNYFIEQKHLLVYEYVLMPSRLYLMAGTGKGNISRLLRDFKRITGQQLFRAVSTNAKEDRKEWLNRLFNFYSNRYQDNSDRHFWQFGNNPRIVQENSLEVQRMELLQIPVKARLVADASHYLYCSAYPHQRVKLCRLQQE